MTKTVYALVKRSDGWAYRVNGTRSKVFASSDAARDGARFAEIEQNHSSEDKTITFEDEFGTWYEPLFDGVQKTRRFG